MSRREALISMGYREVRTGRWAKPVAFQLFTYDETKGEWVCWFKAVDTGEPMRMETKSFADEAYAGPYIHQLKSFEQWTKKDVYNTHARFELGGFDL